jgi:hypothetical protein
LLRIEGFSPDTNELDLLKAQKKVTSLPVVSSKGSVDSPLHALRYLGP